MVWSLPDLPREGNMKAHPCSKVVVTVGKLQALQKSHSLRMQAESCVREVDPIQHTVGCSCCCCSPTSACRILRDIHGNGMPKEPQTLRPVIL